MFVETEIRLIHLYQNWCKCRFALGDQSYEVYGETPIHPIEYFKKLITFIKNNGLHAHCIFNMSHSSHLVELRRLDNTIEIIIMKYDAPFDNKIKKQGKITWSQLTDRDAFLSALNCAVDRNRGVECLI